MPFTTEPQGEKFFIRKNKLVYATPLFATLLVIEASDLIFAVDSIPAVIAISQDPFIVYSSNIFAILGLRSLYFLLASIMGLFCYLKYGISLILLFVGTKMLVSGFYQIQTATSLFVVIGILAISMREIAQKVGVTKPVLYYYFKNKEDLSYEIFSHGTLTMLYAWSHSWWRLRACVIMFFVPDNHVAVAAGHLPAACLYFGHRRPVHQELRPYHSFRRGHQHLRGPYAYAHA